MEYMSRILMLIIMGLIYVLPGYFMHRLIYSYFPNFYGLSLVILAAGLGTFPIGNILVRWKLNNFTSFIELLGGIFLYIYTFGIIFLVLNLALKYLPNYNNYKIHVFLGYFILVGILGLIGYYRANNIKITNYKLSNKNISKNIKILMFADVHLSQVSKKDLMERIVKAVEERKPDMVLIAGDIIDTDTKLIKYDYTKDFKKLKAPMGVYASVGNHEYYGNLNKNMEYIKKMGIKLLYEEGIEVGDFYIIGRSYSFNERKSLKELTKGNINNKEVIVIDHNPKEGQNSIDFGNFLQVSGHTHNGQFFPFNLITRKMFKPDWGLYTENNKNIITTCGVGYWAIPIRFPSFSEIVEIDINKK